MDDRYEKPIVQGFTEAERQDFVSRIVIQGEGHWMWGEARAGGRPPSYYSRRRKKNVRPRNHSWNMFGCVGAGRRILAACGEDNCINPDHLRRLPVEPQDSALRTCSKCWKRKARTEFVVSSGEVTNRCRECERERSRAYHNRKRDNIRARHRDWQLRRDYGIGSEEYDAKAEEQGWVCAICGRPPGESNRRLAVDHDHETGMVRGLLCSGCNIGLGCFKESGEYMLNAINYLNRYGRT